MGGVGGGGKNGQKGEQNMHLNEIKIAFFKWASFFKLNFQEKKKIISVTKRHKLS